MEGPVKHIILDSTFGSVLAHCDFAHISSLILYFCSFFGQVRTVCLDGFSDRIASLCLPITTTKEEGFYVELFLMCAFHLELESKR